MSAEQWVQLATADMHQRTSFEFAIVNSGDQFLGGCGINQIDTANKNC